MKSHKFLLSVFILSLPHLSYSYDLSCNLGDDKKTSEFFSDVNDIVGVDDSESCAIKDQLSKVATWRDSIPSKIQNFISSQSKITAFPELYDQIVANSVNVPAATQEAMKAAQAEWEAADANFNKLDKDRRAPASQKEAARLRYNKAVDGWKRASANVKNTTAPTLKRVNDVLISKITSEGFKAKLKTIAANKHCIKNAEFSMTPLTGFYDSEKSEQDLAKLITSMENEKSDEAITICSGIEKNKSETVAAVQMEKFAIGDEDFFANNEHELAPDKVKRILGKITTSLKSDRPDCEKKIKSVQISTSSNQLANSAEIGKWDFAKLSKNRADFLAGIVKDNFRLNPKDIFTDPTGMNGDGTSGPCPYTAVKGKDGRYSVALKDTSKMKKALNDARYGNISVEIEEVGKGCSKAEDATVRAEHEYYASKCYSVGMDCSK